MKSEIRNPKALFRGNRTNQGIVALVAVIARNSVQITIIGLLSDFAFRISDLAR
jgi:hypothetical protein